MEDEPVTVWVSYNDHVTRRGLVRPHHDGHIVFLHRVKSCLEIVYLEGRRSSFWRRVEHSWRATNTKGTSAYVVFHPIGIARAVVFGVWREPKHAFVKSAGRFHIADCVREESDVDDFHGEDVCEI